MKQMPAGTRTGRIRGMLLTAISLLAVSPVALAQDSTGINVDVSAADRALLGRAESLLGDGRADEAYEQLAAAESELAGNPYFDYLLGIAALDSGRAGEAVFSLQRSIAVEPGFSGARMELGRAYFESGNSELARPLFVALLDENPPPGVRDVIRQYIAAIDGRPAAPQGSFDGYVDAVLGYDSNANGSTSNQQFLGFTLSPENLATESPFGEISAGFSWTAPRSTQFTWLANGRLGHRANTDASFVNATILSGYGGGAWQRGEFFGRFGVDAYWSARDGDSNESYAGMDLLFGRQFAADWDVTLGLRYGANRFTDSLQVLDVDRFLYTVGITRRFSATSRLSVQGIGGSDSEKQSASPYGNSKLGARVAYSSEFGNGAFLHASLGSLRSDYDGLFFGVPREDTQMTAALSLEFRNVLSGGISVIPTIRYIDNSSDVALYEYDRTEIGVRFRWMPR
jgi:hypothetical protein